MRKTLVRTLMGAVAMTAFAAPGAYAQTSDCSALLARYVCAYPDGSAGAVAHLVSVTGDVRISGPEGSNQVSSDAPISPGDSILTGEGQASYDAGEPCTFMIGAQTLVTTTIENACVVVSVTDRGIAPPVSVASNRTGTVALLGAIGLGGGVAAYFLLQEQGAEPDPVTPP